MREALRAYQCDYWMGRMHDRKDICQRLDDDPEMAAANGNRKKQQWEVWLIHRTGRRLGIVEATDQHDAIRIGIQEYGISDPEQKQRVSAKRVG
jgi:hypothetical protein